MSKRPSAASQPQSKKGKSAAPPPAISDDEKPSRGLPLARKEIIAVAFVTLLAVIVRAILIPAQGHATDVATFEAWMNSLIKVGPEGFYGAAGFVDYPPGYMLVLWLFGLLYHTTFQYGDFTYAVERIFVKLPAVLSDIGIGYLTYLIARRSWPVAASVVAMAVFALNPASWLVSAYWGQADSVAAVFLVWGIYLAITDRFEFAWLAIGFAVLIKPQPLVVAPLLLLWQIRRQGLTPRLLLAPLMGLIVAYGGSVWFASDKNPLSVLSWLYDRYHTGIGVYPYNSVNALNLYSINRDFFQPDTQSITFFGVNLGPQYAWGMGIFLALTAAVCWRLWRMLDSTEDDNERELSLYAACFTVLLGFFIVLTRQHERYLFSALAIAPLLWNVGPVMRLATVILSGTFSYNLFYALEYLGAPSQDLHPWAVHPLSFLNFATLVIVAGAFLIDEVDEWANAKLGARGAADETAVMERAPRRGPNPLEGLVGMQPLDYALSAVLTVATGVLLYWGISSPPGRYFDEIYYARAAQEYLTNHNLYEWTHPPVAKLIAAAGAWFFNKYLHAPDPIGVRMTHALMGTLMVPLLYAFAKRLFSSTTAAVTAVFLLVMSGWFYVQARIATPEITIGLIALATTYCAYRLWLASQFSPRPRAPVLPDWGALIGAIGVVCAIGAYYVIQNWARKGITAIDYLPYYVAVAASIGGTIWWALRQRDAQAASAGVVYPDGTWVQDGSVYFPSGERRPLKSATISEGDDNIQWTADGVDIGSEGDNVRWQADGTITGRVGGIPVSDRQHWGLWMLLTALAIATMVASKWYGLFTLAGLWAAAALATGQQYLPALGFARRKLDATWRYILGNPAAWRLPLFMVSCVAAILVIYVLSYIPDFNGATWVGAPAKNWFEQLLSTQWQMFHYHSEGVLTAKHPYSSPWWTWPFESRPVDYYYVTVSGKTPPNEIVSEIIALPNPAVWVIGLLTVPWAAAIGWRQRHKGIIMLAVLYVCQWIFWAISPRIDFEYNVFSNLAIVCLCTTYVLRDLWKHSSAPAGSPNALTRVAVGGYLALSLGLFLYFFPILSGDHIAYTAWLHRMWLPYGGYTWFGWI